MGNDFSSCSLALTGPERFFNFLNNAPFYLEAGRKNCIFSGVQAEAMLLLFTRARRALTNPPWAPRGTRFQELATTGAFRDTYWELISTSLEFDTVQGIFDVGLEGTAFPAFQNLPIASQVDNASAILLMVFLIRTMSVNRANGLFSLLTSNLGRFVFRRVEGGQFGALDTNLFSAFFNGSMKLNILGGQAVSVNGRAMVIGAQPFILQKGALLQLVPVNVCAGLVQGVDSAGPIIEAGPFGIQIDGGVYMSLNEGDCVLCRPLTDIPLGLQRLLDYIGLPFEDYSVRRDSADDDRSEEFSSESSSDSVRAGIQNIPIFGNYNGNRNGNFGAVYEPVEENFLGPQVPFGNANFGVGFNGNGNGFANGNGNRRRNRGCADGACFNSNKGGLDYSVKNNIVTNTGETVDDLLEDNSDKGRKKNWKRNNRNCRRGDCRRRDCRMCGDCSEEEECDNVRLRQRNTLFAYLKNINRVTSETRHCLRKLFQRIGNGNVPTPLLYGNQNYDRFV